MSDENNQPFFNIQRIYLKDMSLEQPNSPAIFLEQEMPSVEVEVDVKAERLAESVFEILVTGTVTAKVSDKVAFLIEAKQAGIFDIRNIPVHRNVIIRQVVRHEPPEGVIEYYDHRFIRITRPGAPNLFIFKHDIKYLFEVA